MLTTTVQADMTECFATSSISNSFQLVMFHWILSHFLLEYRRIHRTGKWFLEICFSASNSSTTVSQKAFRAFHSQSPLNCQFMDSIYKCLCQKWFKEILKNPFLTVEVFQTVSFPYFQLGMMNLLKYWSPSRVCRFSFRVEYGKIEQYPVCTKVFKAVNIVKLIRTQGDRETDNYKLLQDFKIDLRNAKNKTEYKH